MASDRTSKKVVVLGSTLHTQHHCREEGCVVCDGGLSWCTVCGGAEATLPTHCPGRKLTEEEGLLIQDGKIDYMRGKWWRPHDTADHATVELIQHRVWHWLIECVGKEVADSLDERHHRFAEEALELLQACGYTLDQVAQMAKHVYLKSPGSVQIEAADVLICLAPLATAYGFDLGHVTMHTIDKNWENIDKIREKNRNKTIRSNTTIKPGVR